MKRDKRDRKHKRWPKDGTRLSGELRRLAPNLRSIGIAVEIHEGHAGKKTIRVGYVADVEGLLHGDPGGAGDAKSGPLNHFVLEEKREE